jgi:organic hydroperoxide reductase OsmC/OhrA
MIDRQHHYRIVNRWTGNLGTGTSAYAAYSRAHELSGENKSAAIAGSSDPLFRGDRTRYNPEELLLGALSACHMLWVLHLSADAGITVIDYQDDALGEMSEHADGSGEFTRVVLRPCVKILETGRVDEALAIHARAHAVCALTRSMNFPVEHEPQVNGQTLAPTGIGIH